VDSYPVRRAGSTAVVTLPDQLDVANSGQVREALARALAEGVTVLVADLTATQFCSCAGVDALVGAGKAAAEAGAVLRVAGSAQIVRRVIELTGADHLIDAYPDVAAALAGLP
jgi:anti-anti-sigma factor